MHLPLAQILPCVLSCAWVRLTVGFESATILFLGSLWQILVSFKHNRFQSDQVLSIAWYSFSCQCRGLDAQNLGLFYPGTR